MRDTAYSRSMLLEYVKILRLEWDVLRLILYNKCDDVRFSFSEVRCVVLYLQMSF